MNGEIIPFPSGKKPDEEPAIKPLQLARALDELPTSDVDAPELEEHSKELLDEINQRLIDSEHNSESPEADA